MTSRNVVCLAWVGCLLFGGAAVAQEPWQQLYTGHEATGPNVIGLWQFLPGQETTDNSGRGHDLALKGDARWTQDGPFGAALESAYAGTDKDQAQGARTLDADDLSPAGAFTLEAWFAAKPELAKQGNVFLVDKKYYNYHKAIDEANWDYCLYMPQIEGNRRLLVATLGFGTDSEFINGPEIVAEPGKWIHVAFTYDGAGCCRFFVNGKLESKTVLDGRGAVTPGRWELSIGERVGSTHSGFCGSIAQVRLCKGIVPHFTGGLTIGPGAGRTAFVRMEEGAQVPVTLSNESNAPITDGRAQIEFGGAVREVRIADLAPNEQQVIPIEVDTSLRSGDYNMKVVASATSGGRRLNSEREMPVTIAPRQLPNRMPVVMWGGGDIERLKRIGFTHQLISLHDDRRIWEVGKPTEALSPGQVEQYGRMLDDYLRNDIFGAVYVYPGTWVTGDPERRKQFNRVDRNGQVREAENVCGNFPEIRELCYNVGASVAQTFGEYPALNASLIHSEVRDACDLCFHDHDREAFRKATGHEFPVEAEGKGGINYRRLKDFPPNRVIPDDDRILEFYRWFWKNGDGWNLLHSEIHRGLKSTGRDDLWTFFDPAVRVPDVWGSGGDVDIVSQWTYSYPDPIKIGQSTDELLAMAEGKPGQQVMKMTQVIWYRTGTAPELPKDESRRAQWEKDKPEAPFITIAPDHMREAFWSKISRPIRGIMYHGWQSLVDTGATTGYVFTHPRTQEVLAELTRDVVRPLGPTLLQVPDRKADVAVLESFSSQMFAGRGSYGWSESWEANMHLILQWAHLQPRIVFDEAVVRDGLAQYNVLAMPFCDVLTESVVREIRAFQRRGGVVIADEYLCPAIVPDIVVPSYRRSGNAQAHKEALQERAEALRTELDEFYTRYGDADNADIVLRFRQYGDTDYLFALNDKREFGDYVGHHGLVMEKGLPNSGTITVRRKSGFAYDLVRHEPVPLRATANGLALDASFGPGDGHLYMLTDQAIADVTLQSPAQARPGDTVQVTVSVVDAEGVPLGAVVPVELAVLDPQGNRAEFSGYYGAKDGQVSVTLTLAANDEAGTWRIRARELASGRRTQQRLEVTAAR